MREIPRELEVNLAAFHTVQAVADFSFYRLLKEEEYLFPKYYKSGDSVLDLACGLGRTTLLLHEMGLAVRGVDRSDLFIQVAKRRFPIWICAWVATTTSKSQTLRFLTS